MSILVSSWTVGLSATVFALVGPWGEGGEPSRVLAQAAWSRQAHRLARHEAEDPVGHEAAAGQHQPGVPADRVAGKRGPVAQRPDEPRRELLGRLHRLQEALAGTFEPGVMLAVRPRQVGVGEGRVQGCVERARDEDGDAEAEGATSSASASAHRSSAPLDAE
ncbi:hypothetical protein FrEUN1fDRAFT_0202 [Parafrankia sp. EUN1f]|nr:hypothetical protein FrEUN1fDRAFT_0202 [Parafrankia sp. EUN1f]